MKTQENQTHVIRNRDDEKHYVFIGVARDIEADEDVAGRYYVVRSVTGGDLLLLSVDDVYSPEESNPYSKYAYDYEFVS